MPKLKFNRYFVYTEKFHGCFRLDLAWGLPKLLLKSLLVRVRRFISVTDENPELPKAQFEVFSSQVPLMYAIMLISAWALAITFIDSAPLLLAIYVPMFFTLVCCIRIIGWLRSRHIVPTIEAARQALTRTNLFALLIGVAITAWSLSLYPYGDPYMRGNIAFFMAITGVGVIICLLQLRSAAFMVAIIINIPFVLYFSFSGIPSFIGMAINTFLVSGALLMVVAVQFRHFAAAVDARTRLETVNEENFRLANHDSLTGLTNRRKFFYNLTETFYDARAKGQRLAVGIIDLDGFKPVNDLYGHVVGDSLLGDVGRLLVSLADRNMLVSRLGGDEFALIIRDCGSDSDLLAKGEQICTALRSPFVLADATVQISGSIGFSTFPHLADNVHELYERADYALYHGKRTNRGHAFLFSIDHVVEIEQSSRIEQALRNADLDRELTVVYQPIVDIKTRKTRAFEALARWNNPVLGNVPPALFIPVAERAGLVGGLTRIILEKALVTAASWPEDVGLSFNLSTQDICSPDGVVRIVGTITASGIDPQRLDLEITETAMMYDFARAKTSIETLKTLGCGIALDDFGTGYSSLSQLHALPLTKIKIDRSFVSDIDKNPASYKIVKSLLALSRDMGLGCVVEGVETREEMDTLVSLGGQLAQGYYYSHAISEAEIDAFLPNTVVAISAEKRTVAAQ